MYGTNITKIFKTNIEEETLENPFYRKVLFTTPDMQLVVMKIYPGERIPEETHQGTQFIRVEKGEIFVRVGNKEFILKDDEIVMIPDNTLHYFENVGLEPVSLYSIYSPPEHYPTTEEYMPDYIPFTENYASTY